MPLKTNLMKSIRFSSHYVAGLHTVAVALLLAGCASTGDKSNSGDASAPAAGKFKADDGRIINIGQASSESGGMSYKNPHLEKCWLADGFDFNGYDTIYLAPTLSTAKFNEKNPEEIKVHELAKENLVIELARMLNARKIFANVVTKESEIKPGARTLRLESTITEFSKGGGAARYFAGLYGGGQPV